MIVVAAKVAVALLGGWATWCFLHRERCRLWHVPSALLLYYGLRLVLLFVLLEVLRFPYPSDVPGYYEHALRVLGGETPGRDFATPYGFLFDCMAAGAVAVGRTPFALLCFFHLCEAAGIWLGWQALRRLTNDADADQCLLLYLVNPVVLVWLWLSGQDESLQVLGTGALLYLMACGATGLATSLVGTAVMHVTKIFSAWLVAPFMVRQKMRYCLISAGLLVLTYGILWRNGVPPLCATFDRGSGASDDLAHMVTSGNLWYWLSICWKTPIPPWLPEGVVAVLLFVVLLAVWRASRAPALEAVALGTAGCTVVFSCFYKMTFGAYAAAAILPLSWLVRARFSGWGRVGYVIWCVILAVDSSVWYHIRAHPMGRAATAGWLLLQTGLVGLHLAILAQCALLLWRASTGERYGRGKGTSQSFREV